MKPNQNWKPPDSLGYSSLRPIRLSGQGVAIAVIAGLMIVGAFVLGVFLSRTVRRQTESQRLLAAQGVTAEAVITRHWRTGGKSDQRRVAYRFEYQGRVYTDSVNAPASRWNELAVGSAVQIRFVPSQPTISHPVDWEARGLPYWLPYVMTVLVAAIGAMLTFQISRQARLLAEGRPAPGRVTAIRRSDKGTIIRYEFETLNGVTFKGRSGGRAPADGAAVCVLYDPENPRRNALYPLQLVKLGSLS